MSETLQILPKMEILGKYIGKLIEIEGNRTGEV